MLAQKEIWYDALELPYGASWEDVKSAFRRLAKCYHPDVAGLEHSGRFQIITDAYISLRAELFGSPSEEAEKRASVARDIRVEEIVAAAEQKMEEIIREANEERDDKMKLILLRLHSRRLDVRLLAMDALFRMRSAASAR